MPVPAVSVIIPAYNVAPFIGEALDSVRAQTFSDFEAIVVNDGSTDDSEAALAPYFDSIVYIKQENRGISNARNAGLKNARGRYVALLDGDDIWMPNYLESLVGMLERAPEAAVVFPNAVIFGSHPLSGKLYQDIYPCSEPVTFERILTRQCYVFVSAIIRRQAIEDAGGGFDETLRAAEDLDLWLRIARCGHKFLSTPEPLVRYRRRSDSLSSDPIPLLRNYVAVLDKVVSSPLSKPEHRSLASSERLKISAMLDLAIGKELLLQRDYCSAAERFRTANAILHSTKLSLVRAGLVIAPEFVSRLFRWQQGLSPCARPAGDSAEDL